MGARTYLQKATGLNDEELNSLLVPGHIVIGLMNNYKKGIDVKIEIESDNEIEFWVGKCPTCGSTATVQIDEEHDSCDNCRSIWKVKQ